LFSTPKDIVRGSFFRRVERPGWRPGAFGWEGTDPVPRELASRYGNFSSFTHFFGSTALKL